MPATLREHLRYPEDLFRVQTNVWGRYHITDAQSFYEQTNGWSVAQDPGTLVTAGGAATTPSTNINGQVIRPKESRIDPYYLLMKLPGETKESFVLLRSFVPTSDDDSKKKLTAFMVAKSDPGDYGKLITYEMPSDLQIDGPALVNSAIQANTTISAQISLLNQNGSTVAFGNLLLIPIDNSILYVRPLYVSSNNTPVPALKDVIVVWNGQSAMKPTLKEALQVLFPGVKAETFEGGGNTTVPPTDNTNPSTTTTTVPGTTTPSTGEPSDNADQLIADADALLQKAQDDLKTSCATGTCDLNAYQQAVKDASDKLARATQLRGGSTTTTSTGPPTSGSTRSRHAGAEDHRRLGGLRPHFGGAGRHRGRPLLMGSCCREGLQPSRGQRVHHSLAVEAWCWTDHPCTGAGSSAGQSVGTGCRGGAAADGGGHRAGAPARVQLADQRRHAGDVR